MTATRLPDGFARLTVACECHDLGPALLAAHRPWLLHGSFRTRPACDGRSSATRSARSRPIPGRRWRIHGRRVDRQTSPSLYQHGTTHLAPGVW